jgi:phosphoribosylanthranilate isomerase
MPSGKDIKIKICGVTGVDDAQLVAEAGADYIGVNMVEASPRCLGIEEAIPIYRQSTLPVVALFFDEEAARIQKIIEVLNPHAIQLVGQESPSLIKKLKTVTTCQIWKSIHLPAQDTGETDISIYLESINSFIDAGIDAILLDTIVGSSPENRIYGGTGQVSNWEIARSLVETVPVRCFLAGGIKPENARQAIEAVRPYGIDLASGVESKPGKKDPEKLYKLVSVVRKTIIDYNQS